MSEFAPPCDSPFHSPQELVLGRIDALCRADYGLIFDTYHCSSNFRKQFTDRAEYIQYGLTTLKQDFQVVHGEIIDETRQGRNARVVFLMKTVHNGQIQIYAELATCVSENGRWYHLSGQRMEQDQLPENPKHLTIQDFDRLEMKIVF
ncbi:MAG: hypothetical protein JRE16_11645 [Deltaproteobacteria bacterium]|jgi:uncharacterized protein YchJ|nr:hypothetical protein [Deltaproteobacteria bacterium]